jgi:hypothetical protein
MNVFLWIQADDAEDSRASELFMRRTCARLGVEVIGVVNCYPDEDAIASYTATCALAEQRDALIVSSNRHLHRNASAVAPIGDEAHHRQRQTALA